MSTAAKEISRTADDTLAQKSQDKGVISGGHLVARALKNEGVDTIFTMTTPFEQGVEVKLLRASPHRMPLRRPGWANPIKKHKPKYLSTIKIQNQHRLK